MCVRVHARVCMRLCLCVFMCVCVHARFSKCHQIPFHISASEWKKNLFKAKSSSSNLMSTSVRHKTHLARQVAGGLVSQFTAKLVPLLRPLFTECLFVKYVLDRTIQPHCIMPALCTHFHPLSPTFTHFRRSKDEFNLTCVSWKMHFYSFVFFLLFFPFFLFLFF